MAHGNTGNAGKSSPPEPPSGSDWTQTGVATGVDLGLNVIQKYAATGEAAVAAVETASRAFAGVFGVLSIGIGMAQAAKDGKGASGIASAGFANFAGAVAGFGSGLLAGSLVGGIPGALIGGLVGFGVAYLFTPSKKQEGSATTSPSPSDNSNSQGTNDGLAAQPGSSVNNNNPGTTSPTDAWPPAAAAPIPYLSQYQQYQDATGIGKAPADAAPQPTSPDGATNPGPDPQSTSAQVSSICRAETAKLQAVNQSYWMITMTNMVSNRLEVEGSKDAIDSFLDECLSTVNGQRTLHLEKMKPIPAVFSGVEESGDAEIGIEILRRRPLESPGAQSALGYPWITKLGIKTYDQLERWARSERPSAIEAGQKSLKAFAETGHYFSGAWMEDNWGTRYIIDAEIVEQSDFRVVATFRTAWTPAVKLYREMARRLPGLNIFLFAEDEAQDFSYRFVSRYGVVNEDQYGVASGEARQ